MSVELYVNCQCGLRTIEKIMKYLSKKLGWDIEETPSYGSIKNWVEKSGYSLYKDPGIKNTAGGYAQIVDESMMIGSEKMFLTLGVASDKTSDKALTFSDVDILDISVRKVWNSKELVGVFSRTEDKMGKSPSYVISDNATTVCKAIRDKSYVQIPDISHTLAMYVKRQYHNDASFVSFSNDISMVKFKEIMRFSSYLLPPKQRTIARFMNLSDSITWAEKMLACFSHLTHEEQQIFGFLHLHTAIIKELSYLLTRIDQVSGWIRKEGICTKSIEQCRQELIPLTLSDSDRVAYVGKKSIEYLNDQARKLTSKETKWHASTDIIESLFGHYKARKSPNNLNGITRYVMILPVFTKIDKENGTSTIDFKMALEKVFLKDLKQWAEDNLTENLTVKRRKLLAA